MVLILWTAEWCGQSDLSHLLVLDGDVLCSREKAESTVSTMIDRYNSSVRSIPFR